MIAVARCGVAGLRVDRVLVLAQISRAAIILILNQNTVYSIICTKFTREIT